LKVQLFYKLSYVQNEFMEIKDVFYNVARSLSLSINTILSNSDLK
jgi:hypothetical protein